jgi:hypothetical protein
VPSRYLSIYLNDHLAGATLGVELAARTLRENEGTELGTTLRPLHAEIVEDRETLIGLMRELGIRRSQPKLAAAWAAEKVARLKPNGALSGYSPLSRVLELEGLAAGIAAKRALWLSLAEIDGLEARLDPAALAERAASQLERLEPFRRAAARVAFG